MVFSRFALSDSSKAEQPTPVIPEEHVHREYHLQSAVRDPALGFGLVVLSAPQCGSCVHCWRAVKKCQYSIATCTLACVTLCMQCMCTTIEAVASVII